MNTELETTIKSYTRYHNLFPVHRNIQAKKFNQTNAQKSNENIKKKMV